MRAVVATMLVVLAGCYQPDLERCTVHCTVGGDPCPVDMTCASDAYCHTADDTQACPVETFTLSVNTAGTGTGIVTAMPDINCPPSCSETVTAGTDIQLAASANADSRFVSWGGACTGSDSGCELTVSSNDVIGANFNLTETITVEITGGGGGDVSAIQPVDLIFDCNVDEAPCTVMWDEGASVTLSAQPDEVSTFDGWDGDCAGASGTTCTVVLSGPITAIASFN